MSLSLSACTAIVSTPMTSNDMNPFEQVHPAHNKMYRRRNKQTNKQTNQTRSILASYEMMRTSIEFQIDIRGDGKLLFLFMLPENENLTTHPNTHTHHAFINKTNFGEL